MKSERQAMPAQAASERIFNFEEVNLGLSDAEALKEAKRCLQCKKPLCQESCPLNINIPQFIGALAQGDAKLASQIIQRNNLLSSISARICPQETQCECRCVLAKRGAPIAIGHLERYAADWARRNGSPLHSAAQIPVHRIAVIGSGPSGLTCAGELSRRGYQVTLFEALHAAGGVLRYGIPEFRLPRPVLDQELDNLGKLGVRIICNAVVGATFSLSDLMQRYGFDAAYLGCGAGVPLFLGIPGENLKGVYSANEYLTRINLMGAGLRGKAATPVLSAAAVLVIGGGNTALDAGRTARRLGGRCVTVAYRRSCSEMPAREEEVRHAKEEGVKFEFLAGPVEIIGDRKGWVRAVRLVRMQLGEADESGRRRPFPIIGSEFQIDCGMVVIAAGTKVNALLAGSTPELERDAQGRVIVDENGMTSIKGVFAGGDMVRGAATAVLAMGDGLRAAQAIERHLNWQRLVPGCEEKRQICSLE